MRALRSAFRVQGRSSVYESPPTLQVQPSHPSNLAVELQTDLEPAQLRQRLREIEHQLGRVRSADKYAARTVDINLTLSGDRVEHHPDWELPHPQLTTRPFVLVPLCELAPDLVHPVLGRSLEELRRELHYGPQDLWGVDFNPDGGG